MLFDAECRLHGGLLSWRGTERRCRPFGSKLRTAGELPGGARVALQNGRFQFIGRWKAGPLGFNLSKTGVSASVKNQMGSFNFLKPQYSSFKFAGVQLRGKKAAQLQLFYICAMAVWLVAMLAIQLVIFLLWMLSLPILLLWDMAKGFVQGFRDR